ncbi:MAG: hybrid non-ribosomal peptide synthase/polyketide synthase [Myxococcales bacterium]|nr:hybrid non-ribosomal peptide synthase/polyketide synthase [Myxococcales bacterium]
MPSTMLRAGDDRVAPLVCVHPVSGRADDYRLLAAAVSWPGPVLGISAPDPSRDSFLLPDLASRYTDELDLRLPVLLLGWSVGGVIAAEMTRTITARGGNVAFLGVLDSRAPQPEMRTRPTDRETLARFFVYQTALTREQVPPPPLSSTTVPDLLAALRASGADAGIGDEAELDLRLEILIALTRAFFHHDQQAIPVKMHLFETADAHPSHPRPATLGWDHLVPSIEKRVIGGTHFTLMAPRFTEALAQTISACLPR